MALNSRAIQHWKIKNKMLLAECVWEMKSGKYAAAAMSERRVALAFMERVLAKESSLLSSWTLRYGSIKCSAHHLHVEAGERASDSLTYHNDSTVIQFIVPFVRVGQRTCTTATYILSTIESIVCMTLQLFILSFFSSYAQELLYTICCSRVWWSLRDGALW